VHQKTPDNDDGDFDVYNYPYSQLLAEEKPDTDAILHT